MAGPDILSSKASPQTAAHAIKEHARVLGFDQVGVTTANADEALSQRLEAFIDQGRHAGMGWMASRMIERSAPNRLWPEARSVVAVAMNYGPDHNPLAGLQDKSGGVISVYAQNRDYHDVLKKRLKQLGRWTAQTYDCAIKVFVDTAPVMEKPLAAAAGLGWQGKHTNLVSRSHGSWLFLGMMFTEITLAPDGISGVPVKDHCGACRRCLDVCPTDAFPAPYQLDARRCISYLTIEHDGAIPVEFRKAMGNRIYGCDDCLAVCPWNKFAAAAQETAFQARSDLKTPRLQELAQLDDAAFRQKFSGSPIKRIKRDRFIRNVLIAIGNSGDTALLSVVEALLDDAAPVVRGAAIWALAELAPQEDVKTAYGRRHGQENNPDVQEEWRRALASATAA